MILGETASNSREVIATNYGIQEPGTCPGTPTESITLFAAPRCFITWIVDVQKTHDVVDLNTDFTSHSSMYFVLSYEKHCGKETANWRTENDNVSVL